MSASKLFLCNFTALHIYEIFFYNVAVGKTTCFYFCACFYKKFISGFILHESIVYEQNNEIICCCLNCRKQVIPETNYREEPNDFFDDFSEFNKMLVKNKKCWLYSNRKQTKIIFICEDCCDFLAEKYFEKFTFDEFRKCFIEKFLKRIQPIFLPEILARII